MSTSAVRAGDIPGWSKAVAEALERWGDPYPYREAADIRLPMAPRVATIWFVQDLARLLHDHKRRPPRFQLIQGGAEHGGKEAP